MRVMLATVSAAISVLISASPATATTEVGEGFNSENGGVAQTDYTNFRIFDVTSGSVDLIADPGPGRICRGFSGMCVQLSDGLLTSKETWTLNAWLPGSYPTPYRYDSARLLFDVRGSGGPEEFQSFFAGFILNGVAHSYNFSVDANAPAFSTHDIWFQTGASDGKTSLQFFIGSNELNGPILDNVRLGVTAVPEPSTWALLMLGFGFTGAALRRRRNGVIEGANAQ